MASTMENVKLMTVGDGAVDFVTYEFRSRYVSQMTATEYTPTVFDNYTCTMVYNKNINVSLGLWDTAGQDDYEQMRPLAYPGTHVFLVCFSLISHTSLMNVRSKWIPEIRSFSKDVPLVLCGTKLDLFEDAEFKQQLEQKGENAVDDAEANKIAAEIGAYAYVKCSGKTQKNMSEVFRQCSEAGLIFQGIIQNSKPSSTSTPNNGGNNDGDAKKCCAIC